MKNDYFSPCFMKIDYKFMEEVRIEEGDNFPL